MTRSSTPRGCFDDSGQMAGIEVLPFGFMIFVAGALLLANAWSVVDAKLAVGAAARQATRAYVESTTADEALLRADGAARAAIEAHGREPDDLTLEVVTGTRFGRCVETTIEAALSVPSVTLPFIGGFGGTFDVRASHTEIVDPFRSGLAGAAQCDEPR